MFAAISARSKKGAPATSEEAANVLNLASQGCIYGFTSVWEIARLETFLIEHAIDKSNIHSYLEPLLQILPVIDSLRSDLLISPLGNQSFGIRAALAAFVKHGDYASIATATQDFDPYVLEFLQRRPKYEIRLWQPLDCLPR